MGHVRKSPCENGAAPNNKGKTANNTSNSMRRNQSAGNQKTFPIDERVTRMHNQTRWSSTLWISFLSFFFVHPYLIELICGSDMNMMLNHFCVFLYPNSGNFTRHMFLHLSIYLFFKENDINFNIPNFCPPVYMWTILIWDFFLLRWKFPEKLFLSYIYIGVP